MENMRLSEALRALKAFSAAEIAKLVMALSGQSNRTGDNSRQRSELALKSPSQSYANVIPRY